MISTTFIIAASALLVAGTPTRHPINSSLTRLATRAGDKVVCGTTQDADLTACRSILDNWSGNLVESNVCHFGGFWQGDNRAWNVASVPGCSVYVTSTGKEGGAVKEAIERLLGCADASKGKVNGVTLLADGTGVCVGGNDGCGDCFDDSDYTQLKDKREVEVEVTKRKADPSTIGSVAGAITDAVNAAAGSDNTKRANVVRNMVDGMTHEFPGYNVVACHTGHEAKFDGVQGVDWFHQHFEIDIQLGGTIGYELYLGGSGTFKRNGDGGEINWGWSAVVAKDPEQDGSFLTFTSRG